MDYKVIVMPQAESDMEEAYQYIAQRAPDRVQSWFAQLQAEIIQLSNLPARCPTAPESHKLGVELRQSVFGKRSGAYRIIFRIDEKAHEVQILSVRHSARKPIEAQDLGSKSS